MGFFNTLRGIADKLKKKPVVVYFSPHQDDELISMGIDACRTISAGKSGTHVVLCTDGSRSGMRMKIQDGKTCKFHGGVHQYFLDIPQFIAARDTEFRESCMALGYAPDAIHFAEHRAVDACLTDEEAEAIMLSALSKFPEGAAVRTFSPYGGEAQHKDHQCLGRTALRLYRKGYIKDLRLFIEPYCLESCREAYPNLKLTQIRPDDAAMERIRKAAQAYATWDPENRRYAIGYHSVGRVFDAFLADAAGYYHTPEDAVAAGV